MNYIEFEPAFFKAIAQAEPASPRGQVDVGPVASSVMAEVTSQWIADAITTYEAWGGWSKSDGIFQTPSWSRLRAPGEKRPNDERASLLIRDEQRLRLPAVKKAPLLDII